MGACIKTFNISSDLCVVYEHVSGWVVPLGPGVLSVPVKCVKTSLGPQASTSRHMTLLISPPRSLHLRVFCGHRRDVKGRLKFFPAFSA